MSVEKSDVVAELRETPGEEFDFYGDVASINAQLTGEDSVKIGHFLVQADARGDGVGSVVFEGMLEVLRDEEISFVEVEVQALDDGGCDDGVMEFLRGYGFEYVGSFSHHNWGVCVQARGRI